LAFAQGNLWSIDLGNSYLLELNLSGAVIQSYPLKNGSTGRYWNFNINAELAYNPWTQTLYYADNHWGGAILYTLDWSGDLHEVAPVTGFSQADYLMALTFTVGACQ
jgi:uncharacterized protein YjiK